MEGAMKGSILSVLAGIFLIVSVVDGADWKLIDQKQDKEFHLLVDQKSVEQVSDNTYKAWIKYEYSKTSSGKRDYDCMKCSRKRTVSHTMMLKEFNCNERKVRIYELTEYYTDKAPYSEKVDSGWKFPGPDSTDEILMNYICTYRKE
jgi:hypothetical protein